MRNASNRFLFSCLSLSIKAQAFYSLIVPRNIYLRHGQYKQCPLHSPPHTTSVFSSAEGSSYAQKSLCKNHRKLFWFQCSLSKLRATNSDTKAPYGQEPLSMSQWQKNSPWKIFLERKWGAVCLFFSPYFEVTQKSYVKSQPFLQDLYITAGKTQNLT